MSRLEDVLELVEVSSVSRHEAALCALVEARLRSSVHLEVERIGDNVVARTTGRRAARLLVAGHLDTVPGDSARARIDGDVVRGVGACDMKGSLAVMIELASDPTPRSVEVTWVFYAREEISRAESGLVEIAQLRPDLLLADVAVLGEPTGGRVEAGCQGSLRVELDLAGRRAHSARPYVGRNAVHRLAPLIARIASYEPRSVSIDDVTFTEQLQAVAVEGGVAANVVPDRVTLTVNHRVAPDRTRDDAVAELEAFLADQFEESDEFRVADWAPAATPSLGNDRLAALVRLTGRPPVAKVGWTDVATFQSLEIPATNFGAGDPLLAHRDDEFVTRDELDEFARVLREWLA